MTSGLEATITSEDLKRLAVILGREADGKQLRKELAANLRKASMPVRDEARSAILSMESGGLPHEGEGLRQAIASHITVDARLTGQSTGARVKVSRKGMPRGFDNAPKRTNAPKWRHKVFGNAAAWVDQVGKPRWFDDVMQKHTAEWRGACLEAMNAMAARIARR